MNYGCDPTKALLYIADLFDRARHADRYGLKLQGAAADWPAVQARIRQVVDQMRGGSDDQARTNWRPTPASCSLQ